MPAVYEFVNHGIVDISSYVDLMRREKPTVHSDFIKAQDTCCTHRAMDDVEASIKAYRWCRDHISLTVDCPDDYTFELTHDSNALPKENPNVRIENRRRAVMRRGRKISDSI